MRTEQTNKVRPKKSLGQHFLHDQQIARRIVDALEVSGTSPAVLEIGPGMGVLTKYLLEREGLDLKVIEIDRDSVAYLKKNYAVALNNRIVEGDFLETEVDKIFPGHFSIIGNFPYNISSQIFFRVLARREYVDQVVCMLQKEVADRIAAPHGSKTYGILSVLLQAYYDIDNLFKVPPGVFTPPPKVMSAVIRLRRNQRQQLGCNETLFVQVVKQAFNTRRKTLRNALKNLNLAAEITTLEIFNKRAEQLSVQDFINLTSLIERSRGATTPG
ncbi:16S rRNA (adenine(1518)-N(6)/adenine(1519)-N(6))-dimethyltransferase RsmA [Chryseolinea lacunae]|uniref:Ribosomal RNA small subunit methyltransferase A n=1 Tax=Chryseolinea lacunae TaxID=2801331 RepID=A0ABS1KU54_9BACT|nr:16S rRNA (adenine(1518)-N(6)/adenine(1519)-N(6))-dimethyltransferase RsmA [Chryseolinea lacunae]MBL0742865.1 16S rRNA (adenine(1518)-N(6)/adenine(1519)-N(6))-dimethyltransferase RsmA [Chryseolinea lacunae]